MQSKPAKSGKVSNMKRFGKGGFEFLTNWVVIMLIFVAAVVTSYKAHQSFDFLT